MFGVDDFREIDESMEVSGNGWIKIGYYMWTGLKWWDEHVASGTKCLGQRWIDYNHNNITDDGDLLVLKLQEKDGYVHTLVQEFRDNNWIGISDTPGDTLN